MNAIAEALRYLADHPRPIGGQERFNAEHLCQLAQEAETTISRAEVAAAVRDALDALRAEFDAAIRVAIDLQNVPAASLGGYWRDRLDATIAALGLPEPAACTWTPDGDGTYNTDCGHAFVLNDGTPVENELAFCGYCGKRLIEEVSE